MENISIQQQFFDLVRQQLAGHESLVTQVADLLGLSQDSAYRRIRGEKPISFEELQTISKHFKISVDKLLHSKASSYIFRDNSIEKEHYNFNDHLDFHISNMLQLRIAATSEIIFYTRDIAIFYFYQFPELLAFKYFYWMHTVFADPDFSRLQFSVKEHINKFDNKGKKAAGLFAKLDSTEIWSQESLTLTLRQVEYYKKMELFKDKNDLDIIYDKLAELIDHIERQADTGKKFLVTSLPDEHSGNFTLYANDFMLGGNNILVRSEGNWFAFINHSIMNYLGTKDRHYCENLLLRIHQVIKRSDRISTTGEKQRRKFFNGLRKKVMYFRSHSD